MGHRMLPILHLLSKTESCVQGHSEPSKASHLLESTQPLMPILADGRCCSPRLLYQLEVLGTSLVIVHAKDIFFFICKRMDGETPWIPCTFLNLGKLEIQLGQSYYPQSPTHTHTYTHTHTPFPCAFQTNFQPPCSFSAITSAEQHNSTEVPGLRC